MSRARELGTAIPEFELSDENGDLHRLSQLQGEDAMVLRLTRGEHCPRERPHHRELLRYDEWCSVAFAELVSVLPNDLHDTLNLRISAGARWSLLADTDLLVQRHFEINEYTDTHHDHAGVSHALVLAPGLAVDEVYVRLLVLGSPVQRPAVGRPRRSASPGDAGLRDSAAGSSSLGGRTSGAGAGKAPGRLAGWDPRSDRLRRRIAEANERLSREPRQPRPPRRRPPSEPSHAHGTP